MRSVEQGIAWAKSAGAERRNGKSWAGWCQSYVYRFSGATKSSTTAYLAYKGSGHVQSKDPMKAPPGAFHWWSDGGPGHVAISLGHGMAAMASASVTTHWGVDQGKILVSEYNRAKPGLKYLGWTFDMLGQMMTDVREYIEEQTRAEKAAADKAKAAKVAAEKAAHDKAVADKAAKDKAAAHVAAEHKALAEAAAAAVPNPEVEMYFPLVKEIGHPEVYLLTEGGAKTHISAAQWQVYKILGASIREVPAGALGGFKSVSP